MHPPYIFQIRERPRRLEPDTTAYLLEVKSSLLESGDDEDDTKAILLWNVLEELAPRIASAASDRHACEIIEVLLEKMSPRQLCFFVHKMEGYYSHLWTNRYSSHVLQRILSKVGDIVQAEVEESLVVSEEDEERSKDVPTMATLIVAMCQEVKNEWITLVNDISASHVLRSVLCALGGRTPVAEKRGKKGKHGAIRYENMPKKTDDEKALNESKFATPPAFADTLVEIIEVMMDASDDRLANFMFDHHAGPFFSMAVRVCPQELRADCIKRLLNWDDEEVSKKRFYDYAGDTVASHFLEALSQCATPSMWTSVYERCLKGRLLEFSEHAISNYVVQNFIQYVPTKEQAEIILDEMKDSLWSLLSMHRPGVVWRLAECCVRFEINYKNFFTTLAAAVTKQESKKPAAVQKDIVPALIALELSNSQNAKISLNITGARIIETLLKFPSSIIEPLITSVLNMNSLQLTALAKDSIGSRCIIEPIWNSENEQAKISLFNKFKGNFGTLALDRNGAFSVIKCFNNMNLDYKTTITEELAEVDGKLSGNHFSSMVLTHCNVHEFKTNHEKWVSTYERKRKVKELFSDLVDDKKNKPKKKSKKKAA
ncbi:hypothetical protein THRCLA_04003 [Thraustotheca clavata]|uniref:Pumilio domain-containing protein NOP9 n=1 Tax=Thraustotheca clavata TaxID=74557 RepID=A0A1W0A080_9STRA|nr:hypothetical protein THRCLA_04003 [Thraustotheca clavata]